MIHRKVKTLIESKNISDQIEGIEYLQSEDYITEEIKKFLIEQHATPKYSYLTPNKFISINLRNEDIYIEFKYDIYKKGEIFSEISKIKNLEKLYFHFGNHNSIPRNITNCTTLKELRLNCIGNNDIVNFEELFAILGSIKKLEKLEMNYFRMKVFPSNINGFKNLKKLYLHYNFIEIIPQEIERFKNLEIINLSTNEIELLPKNVTKLNKLKLLDLRNNKLKEFPIEILKMKSLNFLDISDNRIPEWLKRKYLFAKHKGLNLIK